MATQSLDTNWKQVQAELRQQMTRATFDAYIQPLAAHSCEGGELVLMTRSATVKAVVETRLLALVERAAAQVIGSPVEVAVELEFAGQLHAARDGPFEVRGSYEDGRSAIIKPERLSIVTEYFRLQWVPRLGIVLAWVIIALRRRAYYNKKTREKREGFRCKWQDIARELHVSPDTVARALKRECRECDPPHPVHEHFILERAWIYRDNPRRGRRERVGTFVRVRMDDPLTPADVNKLETRCAAPRGAERGAPRQSSPPQSRDA